MLLTLIFILPLIVALACLGLSRLVATRWLGVAAAAVMLAGGVAMLAAKQRAGLPLALLDHAWLALAERPIRVSLLFDSFSWAPALLVLLGSGVALLVLALIVPGNLRGFGGLFAAALLAMVATVLGLANQSPLLLPFAWSLAALLAFLMLRATGALAGSDASVIVLLAGLGGALLALGATLLSTPSTSGTTLATAGLVSWVLFGMLALGVPPFHVPQQRLAEAPAPIAGMLMTLGLPLLGGVTLIRTFSGLAAGLPRTWHLILTVLGIAALLICAAGATGTTQLRRLLSWGFSAQMGLVLLALGQGGTAAATAAPALLANGALATLLGYLAVMALENRAGTDDLAAIALREPLILPGILFMIGAAASIGLPGFLGFWAHRWLIDELARSASIAIAPVLAGSALLGLAFLPALAVFWRRAGGSSADQQFASAPGRPNAATMVGAIGALPLLIFGIAPQLLWRGWLSGVPGVAGAPALPGVLAQAGYAVAALLLVATPAVMLSRAPRREGAPADSSGAVVPAALGESLAWLAWPATATSAFESAWHGLLRASRLLVRGLQLFEQRYYLAGLLIAVIVVIMLFIQ